MPDLKKSLNPFHHSKDDKPDIPSEPPPSYDDAVGGPSSSSPNPPPAQPSPIQQHPKPQAPPPLQHQQSQQPPPQLPPGIARQFPPSFNLYTDGWGSRTYTLAEHQHSPFYSVRLHTGWSGEPPVVLHSGPNADAAPLMAAVDFEAFSSSMTITLPPIPGRPMTSEVPVDSDMGWHRTYRFTIETGLPGHERPEAFEWRHSYGEAIAALDGDRDGWKLVRMATHAPAGFGNAEFRAGGMMTSDMREIVAVWTDAYMSMTKQAKFAFMGSGNVGVLGERWAVMAVMTALGIWEKERRAKQRRRH